jgi:hypothetical protein
MRARLLAAALALAMAAPVRAAGPALTEADLATFARLQDAKALGEVRRSSLRSTARPKGNAEHEQALREAGWTAQRYDAVSGEVEAITGTLDAAESEPELAEDYRRQLAEEHDAATVARVRAQRAALDWDQARERAEKRVREEQAEAATGRRVSVAELQGSWVFDLEASLAHVQATTLLPAPAVQELRTSLEPNRGTTYAFAGDAVEVRGGARGDAKGTFRVEGRDLVIFDGRRESRLQVGLKGPDLVISMFGVGTVYRRR